MIKDKFYLLYDLMLMMGIKLKAALPGEVVIRKWKEDNYWYSQYDLQYCCNIMQLITSRLLFFRLKLVEAKHQGSLNG